MKEFTITITTKNRLEDLKRTLVNISDILNDNKVSCIICDDGSNDGTYEFIKENYTNIELLRNNISKGLIFSRNRMMNLVKTKYAISLDDDAHFITTEPLELISNYFDDHPCCGLIACSIFWGKKDSSNLVPYERAERVQGFVGCGHIWNMKAWKSIPNYPSWFVFYGEEGFAAFQLFKTGWEVHYVPKIFVHHRVDNKERKKDKDYQLRLRRSLRAGWYLFFLFYPWSKIPRRFAYTIWIQIKNKVLNGDGKATMAILQGMGDVFINIPRLLKESNRLSKQEFLRYSELPATKLYWKPEDL